MFRRLAAIPGDIPMVATEAAAVLRMRGVVGAGAGVASLGAGPQLFRRGVLGGMSPKEAAQFFLGGVIRRAASLLVV